MENLDESNSLPVILKETENLYKSGELNKEKLQKARNELDQKYRYLAHLEKQKDYIMKTVAEKQATLSTLQMHAKHYESTNTELKNRAMNITKTFNELHEQMNSTINNYTDIENRINKIENVTKYISTSNEQINALQSRRDKVKSDLENKQKEAEKKTSTIRMENNNLKKQLTYLNDLKDEMGKAYNEDALTVLGNRSTELEKKIEALKRENDSLRSEYDTICQSLNQTEIKNQDLDLRYNEVDFEVNSLVNNLTTVKNEQAQLTVTKDNLEMVLKTLDDKLLDANSTWYNLENEDYSIKQDIDQIKQDIADREKKLSVRKCELSNIHQLITKEDENIEQITVDINKLNTDLEEVTGAISNIELSQHCTDQADQIIQNLTSIENEKESLLHIIETKEAQLKAMLDKLNNDRNSNVVELMTLENQNTIEISVLEKKLTDLKLTSSKLETEVKSSENVESELEGTLNNLEEKQKQLCAEFKQTEKELAQMKEKSQLISIKTGAVQKPRALPRIKENASNPKAKRNWDSDSSMEVEEIKFNDYLNLKRKSKKAYKRF